MTDGHIDEVMVALDDMLLVLRESTERNKVSTRRAQTIRRLRSHKRPYRDVLRRVSDAVSLGVTRENLDLLIEAHDRLERAAVRALHVEGVAVEDIAVLCDITHERTSTLLAARA